MKKYEAHFSDVTENQLGLVIGYRNVCLLVIHIWTVTYLIGSKI
ncbi:hypothetical protein [Bacillus toyonensis]|nr:hypothetical protein [Bacillus toyonensis]